MKKKKNGLVFWVRQGHESDNCRLNALNAFYGRSKLTIERFDEFCAEFDRIYQREGSRHFTSFAEREDGSLTCVVDFIVLKEARYACTVKMKKSDDDDDDDEDGREME